MTTSHRKAQPPSKFNFDRNSLRTLEISHPIQIPPPAQSFSSSTLPHRTTSNVVSHPNVYQPSVSTVPRNLQSTNVETNKLVPVRPAPVRPNFPPQRTPSFAPTPPVVVSPRITRTASLRGPCDKIGAGRPLSSASFRPSCPPPRPPPPKPEPSSQQHPGTYEDIKKPGEECERSDTPGSTYYDDCQTLDFSDTPLSFVHRDKRDNSYSEIAHKSSLLGQRHQPGGPASSKPDSKTKNEKSANKAVIWQPKRTGPNSVAALAEKFEKQESVPSKNFIPDTSMRPPFKSRPLPPRPGNTEV